MFRKLLTIIFRIKQCLLIVIYNTFVVIQDRGKRNWSVSTTIWRSANPSLRRYVVPTAKRVGADLLDIAAPEIGNVLTAKKKFKSVAADVGKRTLRKKLGGGKIRKCCKIRRIPPETSRRRRTTRDNFSKLT